jgi:O-acetyl-ADP-ribose deacetylase (regulator of RNase III)
VIRYVDGDATVPEGADTKVIAHVCNDVGVWGAGFVLAVSRRWSEPERVYLGAKGTRLGLVQLVTVGSIGVKPCLFVANMIAQHGLPSHARRVALDYQALSRCLDKLAIYCGTYSASVHMPRIGCGIAGGTWSNVEELIERSLGQFQVTIYDLPKAVS